MSIPYRHPLALHHVELWLLKDPHQTTSNLERSRLFHEMTRTILSDILAITATEIQFARTKTGKPYLDKAIYDTDVQFNLSHSGSIALLALTRDASIGVDIEQMLPIPDMLDVAGEFLSSNELELFLALPEAHQINAFYNAWTRKEAYAKALGEGLRYPFRQLHVPLTHADTFTNFPISDSSGLLPAWALVGFQPIQGYAAAVAVEHANPSLSLINYG